MDRDNVLETWTGTGTGNPSLAGAQSGFRSFSGLTGYFAYKIANGNTEWEIGVGSVDGSYPVMVRSTVLSNHLGTTATVNFTAGTKSVALVQIAERSVVVGSTAATGAPRAVGGDSIVGGSNAIASGSYGIALGANIDTGNGSDVIAMGRAHTISGSTPNVIAMGNGAVINIGAPGYCRSFFGGQVSHPYSAAEGPYAVTRGWGTKAWAPWDGASAHAPYAQHLDVAWNQITTNATPTVMRLAPSTNQELLIGQKRLMTFDILLSAYEQGGTYRSYSVRFTGAAVYNGFVDTVITTAIATSAGFAPSAALSVTSEILRLTATGVASTNIRWQAHGRILEANSNV